ncbi:MAG: peptide deformylase [Planctomycetes bacterium]|nr:peptide deformylase [Planctomycetota bacterium]
MPHAFEFDLTLYPDPVLRKPSEPVRAFDEELRAIVEGLFERMRKSNGVGLAAPQVGLKQRILVLNPTGEAADDLALVNPEIVDRFGQLTLFEEGCLSFPGIYAEVKRPERCKVRAFAVDGKPIEAEYDGFVARIVQHEYDHLEGVLLVDRMSPADKLANKARLEELVFKFKRKQEQASAR